MGIGSMFGDVGALAKEIGRAVIHGYSSGIQSHLQGGSFGQGFLSGGISSGLSSGATGLNFGSEAMIGVGGLGGGIGSAISGGDFFHGFGQGLAVSAFNHTLHSGANALGKPDDYIIYDGEYLNYYDDFGNFLFKVKANSGSGEHMNNPNSQGVQNEGPIPEGAYELKLTTGVPTEKSGGGWGDFGLRLNSKFATKVINRLILRRGGFFLHQDGNYSTRPGSAGCIAICGKSDTYKVWNALKSYQAKGNSHLYLHVQYK